jgi:hypothetical protein
MAFYVTALLLLPGMRQAAAWRVAIPVAVLGPVILLYTYPALAADVFDYLMIGRIVSQHGANPYVSPPGHFPLDPYFPPVGWPDLKSVYGPLWVDVLAAITGICGDASLSALVLTKSVAVAAHWLTAALVYLTARKLDPRKALFAFVAYAWNPLVLVHFAVDGHNDAVMILFLMAAIYYGLDRRWGMSLPMLTLSALVKFVPLVLFPLFLWQARQDRRALLAGVVVSALLAVLAFEPFWAGWSTFDGVRDQGSRMTSSPAALASFFVPDGWLRPAALLIFAAGYLAVIRRGLGLVPATYGVMVLFLFVLSFWTKTWYFTWLVALGAVLGGAAFWVSVPGVLGLFVSNLFGGWGWLMNWFDWQDRGGQKLMEAWLTSTTLGGWLLGAAWLKRRTIAGRRDSPATAVEGAPG